MVPNLAFVFPGQGSQSQGMLSGLGASHPVVRQTFDEASSVLGMDLWSLVQDGPEDALNSTVNTQPAMLAAGVALWRVWCETTDIRPLWMAGHSLGEYTALVCADAMSFADAISLVRSRGELMQSAVPEGVGAMAAIIGLEDDQIRDACLTAETASEKVAPANYNAPGQVVIAGHAPAVLRAMAEARGMGAKRALQLPVSVPSHCVLMRPAAERFAAILADVPVAIPRFTVLHNVDATARTESDSVKSALVEQLYSPVRWVDTIQQFSVLGVEQIVECGPGKVLAGLNKRIAPGSPTTPFFDAESLAKAMESCQ